MNNKRTYLSPPHMGDNELNYINEVFKSNYIAPLGEYVDKFEESIKQYTNCKYALALNTATSAIHLALRVLGVKKDDFVLVSDFTFIGSVAPILYQYAKPIFIDCDNSWNMSADLLYKFLKNAKSNKEKMPKALVLVHIYGQIANIEKIVDICKEFNIKIIEDCAESLGAFHDNKHCGNFADIGVFSFNGNKIITTSGGGMMISNNEEYVAKARYLSTVAKSSKFIHYEHDEYGYNYRMSNVLAAIGVAQMEVLEKRVLKKIDIFNTYKKCLQDSNITFMPSLQDNRDTRWLSTILLPTKYEKFMSLLESENIESRPLWKPMHMQNAFKQYQYISDNNLGEKFFKYGLCLPSGTNMSLDEVEHIANIIKKAL